ncbi:MAG: class I SAM-dependent methyltransferase [Planctomycetota bacterium]|jgi:SAM-dependent methyltransferase
MATATLLDTPPEYFEAIYMDAHGDPALVPWEDGKPNPALVNWLNAVAPSLIRCGARVAVVGCGLGDDARELIGRGYDVTAFDCSETAIEWARRRDPLNADCYVHADLFHPPTRWRHRFDLVVEINNLHALDADRRLGAASAIADLLSPRGHLLVINQEPAELEDEIEPVPALTEERLQEAMGLAGLVADGNVSSFLDDGEPPLRVVRAVYRRA